MTIVAICTRLNTPEGIIAPNVPASMMDAVMMTVPILAIDIVRASRIFSPLMLSSRKRSSKEIGESTPAQRAE